MRLVKRAFESNCFGCLRNLFLTFDCCSVARSTFSSCPVICPSKMVVARKSENLRRSSIMNYEQSVMFGQYREQLASFARDQAMKQSEMTGNEGEFRRRKRGVTGLFLSILNQYGEWILLAFLGLLMALISFFFDLGINYCYKCKCISCYLVLVLPSE